MASESSDMKFVPMRSITKDGKKSDLDCTDWIATEKIHGSSYQFSSSDGIHVKMGARRRDLAGQDSFVKCDITELFKQYNQYVIKAWHFIKNDDQWADYRAANDRTKFEQDEDDEITFVGEGECHMRIYGELYGGGGIEKPIKSAVQKEIIYSDEHRFYVFGITVNYRWMNVVEMNTVCKMAGFPFYGVPVCEPKESLKAIKEWLVESNFLRSLSAYTDLPTGNKCHLEGVVMSPLTRPPNDYGFHAVKFLAPKFMDVKEEGFGKAKISNFCTKQRYHSVISKLDIWERKDTQLVVDMFIEDIIKECPRSIPSRKLKSIYIRHLLGWLMEDEYFEVPSENINDNDKVEDKKSEDGVEVVKGENNEVVAMEENGDGHDYSKFNSQLIANFLLKFDKNNQAKLNNETVDDKAKRSKRQENNLSRKDMKELRNESRAAAAERGEDNVGDEISEKGVRFFRPDIRYFRHPLFYFFVVIVTSVLLLLPIEKTFL